MRHTQYFAPGAASCHGTCRIAITLLRMHRAARRLPANILNASKKGNKSSPWSTRPTARSNSYNSSGSSKSKDGHQSSKAAGKGSKSVQRSSSTLSLQSSEGGNKVPSGTGFSSTAVEVQPPVQVYKLTPPLTPQLLDELSGWEVCATPLWSTFTGHCEGEWLGQYAAYTPWAGDPEPVWADESGAQLLYAYSRASEARQAVQVQVNRSSSSFGLQAAAETSAAGVATGVDHAQECGDYEELDMLVRTTVRSASIGSLIGGTSVVSAAAAAAAEMNGTPAATACDAANVAADDESEGFSYNRDGYVVFTGGSYSLGPDFIAAPEVDQDDWLAAVASAAAAAGGAGDAGAQQDELYATLPHTTVVIEQCLVSCGDVRLRLVATLQVRQPPGEAEVDVEIARLLLYKEHWYGTAESTSGSIVRKSRLLDRQSDALANSSSTTTGSSNNGSSSRSSRVLQLLPSHKFDVPIINWARPQPDQLAGSWNVFLVSAVPVVEENPDTLQDEQVWVYSSREERLQWHVPGITSSAALGNPVASSTGSNAPAAPGAAQLLVLDDDGSGGSFWLPGGAAVTLRMVSVPDMPSSSSNGSGHSADCSRAARGLMIGLHWLIDEGSCEFIERQYDAEGQLVEVRHGSAVLGGWCGGRG